MKSYIIFLFIAFISVNSSATNDPIKGMLPEKIRAFTFKKTLESEITRTLGPAAETENTKTGEKVLFYNLSGRDYDTTLALKKGKLLFLVYSPNPGVYNLNQIETYVGSDRIDEGIKQMENSPPHHEKGREFIVKNEKDGYQLKVSNNPKLNINQIFLWSKGEKQP